MTDEDLKEKVKGYLKGTDDEVNEFLSRISYIPGSYDGDEGFQVSPLSMHGRTLAYSGHILLEAELCSGASPLLGWKMQWEMQVYDIACCVSAVLAKGAGGQGKGA